VLYVARADRPERHRGAVVPVHRSAFAPPAGLRRDRPDAFRVGYLEFLRRLWRHDRVAFLALIDGATGGRDLTLVDDWGDLDHAPRRILAATLKQIASTEKANAVRRARERARPRPGAVAR
jgi:hypothetical protein